MILDSLNRSGLAVPRSYLGAWLKALSAELLGEKIIDKKQVDLGLFIAFVSEEEIASLNESYRGKPRPTDVLSFESDDPELIGELVICPQVIKKQAKEHKLKEREEYAYMLTHGVLHLLGYEHEQGGEPERIMFELQDRLFEKLRDKSLA